VAIDTQNKRRSTIAVLPVPDGSVDTQDKPQVCWIYSGLTIRAPALEIIAAYAYVQVSPTRWASVQTAPEGDAEVQVSPTGEVLVA